MLHFCMMPTLVMYSDENIIHCLGDNTSKIIKSTWEKKKMKQILVVFSFFKIHYQISLKFPLQCNVICSKIHQPTTQLAIWHYHGISHASPIDIEQVKVSVKNLSPDPCLSGGPHSIVYTCGTCILALYFVGPTNTIIQNDNNNN